MNILFRNFGQFTELSLEEALIPRQGRPKIQEAQYEENNQIRSAGENGV
jgi:hypothetical protein